MNFGASNSTYSPNPEAMAAYRRALSMAENVTSQPYEPYQGQLTAGFTPDQMRGFEMTRQMQGMVQPYINSATALTNQAVNYSDPRNFNAQSLQQFQSPYQQNVIDTTMANLSALNAQNMNQANASNAAAGGFGGSGSYLGRAAVQKQNQLANAQTLAQLQQSGYQQAVGQYNQQQQQAIQTAQNAAYGLGQLGQNAQQSALQGIQALMGTGAQQQQLQQQQLTGAYQQWLQAKAFPYQQAGFYAGIASGIAPNMGGTTNTTSFGMGNQQQQQAQGGGGAAGMGMSVLSMLPSLFGMSDKDDKTDIKYLGKDDESGEKIYSYRYKGDPKSYPKVVGPMAQDIERHSPERVHEVGGHKIVQGLGRLSPSQREHYAAGGAGGAGASGTAAGVGNLGQLGGTASTGQTTGQPASSIYDVPAADTSNAGFGNLQAGTGQTSGSGSMDPNVSSFIQGIFDPKTADQMARAKWVNQPTELGQQQFSGDNFAIPPALMQDGGESYPYHPQAGSPMADGGRVHKEGGGGLGNFFDLVNKQGIASGPYQAPSNPAAEGQKVGIGALISPAKDVAKGITESAANKGIESVMKNPTTGSSSGAGGGGGAPKMPSMKAPKQAGAAQAPFDPNKGAAPGSTPGAPGGAPDTSNQPTSGDGQVSEANKAAGQGGFNFEQHAEPLNAPPVVEQMHAAPVEAPAAPPTDFAAAAPPLPEIPLLGGFGGFGGFADGGRVHRAGGGGAAGGAGAGAPGMGATAPGGGFGVLGQEGKGLGDIVLGDAASPGDAAGIGNLMAGQETLTGQNLMNKMDTLRFAHSAGPQKSPTEQGQPAMPSPDFYTKPRVDLPSVTQTEHYGEQNDNPVFGYMMMGGMGGKGGGLGPIGGMGLAGQINQQNAANDARAKQAQLKAQRTSMLNDPANFPVQGYYTSIASPNLNENTGLFNVDYTGAYRGYPYKDGGRVAMRDGGGDPLFNRIVGKTFGYEGGYNPGDTGGQTMYGISQKAHPGLNIKGVTKDMARDIYKKEYYDAIGADKLPPALRMAAFDTAVIAGPARARQLLKQSGGDPMKFLDLRANFMHGLVQANPAKYGRYERGWNNRNADLRKTVASMMGENPNSAQTVVASDKPVQRAVPYDPSKPSLAYNVMPQRPIPIAKPIEKGLGWSSPGATASRQVAASDTSVPPGFHRHASGVLINDETGDVVRQTPATRGVSAAAGAPAGSVLHRINPADPSGPLLGSVTTPSPVAAAPVTRGIEPVAANKPKGFLDKLASELSPVGTAHAGDRGVFPGDKPAAEKSAPGFVPEAAPINSVVAKGSQAAPSTASIVASKEPLKGFAPEITQTKEPISAEGLPRIDKGPAASSGDRPAWNPNASTPPQSGEGVPSIDKGEAGPTDARPAVHMPGYTYAPAVQEEESPWTAFGANARRGDMMGETPYAVTMAGAPMGPWDNGAGFNEKALTPSQSEKSSPSKGAETVAADKGATGQKYWGDWRDAEPWKSDPIGGFFDTLSGEKPMADKPGTWTPGQSAGFDIGNLFGGSEPVAADRPSDGIVGPHNTQHEQGPPMPVEQGPPIPEELLNTSGEKFDENTGGGFARGGLVRPGFDFGGVVRHAYATDGSVEDEGQDPVAGFGEALSGIGEGIGNVVSGIGEGFGSLLSGGEQGHTQPVAQDRSPAYSAPSGGGLFGGRGLTWSPFQSGLLAAGLATMASDRVNPLQAIGEGGLRGLQVYEAASANQAEQDAKEAMAAQDAALQEKLYPNVGGAGPASEGDEAVPEGEGAITSGAGGVGAGAAGPSGAAPVSGGSARLQQLRAEHERIRRIPVTAHQVSAKNQALKAVEWEIAQEEKMAAGSKIAITKAGTDDMGNDVFMYTSGPRAGEIVDIESLRSGPAAGDRGAGQMDWGKHHEEFLEQLPSNQREQIRAYAEGRQKLPTGKEGAKLLKLVTAYDPDFEAGKYDLRRSFMQDEPTKLGGQLVSANTAIKHADSALEAADKMDNSSWHLWNKIKHGFKGEITEDPQAVEFKQAVEALSGEVEKYFKGGAPADAAIKRAQENLNTAQTPAEYTSALRQIAVLMKGKSDSLADQWKQNFGGEEVAVPKGKEGIWGESKNALKRIDKRYYQEHPEERKAMERQRKAESAVEGVPQREGGRQIVKTGIYNGRKVVQYSDGTTEYAQ